jgi:hypothetical protein
MNGNSHRIAYEALKAGLEAAEAEGDAAALGRAIALDSPGAAAEIQARVAELSLPRQVPDPSFDPSFARQAWMMRPLPWCITS